MKFEMKTSLAACMQLVWNCDKKSSDIEHTLSQKLSIFFASQWFHDFSFQKHSVSFVQPGKEITELVNWTVTKQQVCMKSSRASRGFMIKRNSLLQLYSTRYTGTWRAYFPSALLLHRTRFKHRWDSNPQQSIKSDTLPFGYNANIVLTRSVPKFCWWRDFLSNCVRFHERWPANRKGLLKLKLFSLSMRHRCSGALLNL